MSVSGAVQHQDGAKTVRIGATPAPFFAPQDGLCLLRSSIRKPLRSILLLLRNRINGKIED